MPIVNDSIEYEIPDNIKELITDDFLKEFRNQLFRIHKEYSLDTFAEYGIPMNTSTGGWYAAFGKACLITHKEQLLDYWDSLPWYDSDVFDGELADMLIDRHFILGDLSKVIEEQLNIKENDLRICNDCGKLYSKDMVAEIKDTDEDKLISHYRCFCCQDIKDSKDNNPNATDYYKGVLQEIEEYKRSCSKVNYENEI